MLICCMLAAPAISGDIELNHRVSDKIIDITIGEQLFTQYHYGSDLNKPILYPVRTASGKDANRHYPMRNGVPNESDDHPHHQSVYFTYGDVDGIDFWSNRNTTAKIVSSAIVESANGVNAGRLEVENNWVLESGETTLKEHRVMIFRGDHVRRIIDFDITLTAVSGDVVFNDTKEGMFAIRVAPELKEAEKGGNALYLNAEGLEGADEIWGKRSKWVALRGQLEGEPTVIAIMHHPSSVQYPTYWHARNYGLFAANPFGKKDFQKGSSHINFTLQKGESAKFGFRLLINSGSALDEVTLENQYEEYLKDLR